MKFVFLLFTLLLTACQVIQLENTANEIEITTETILLGAPFSNHMVLQADKEIRIWGWTAPNTRVTVTLANHNAKVTSDEQGAFLARLASLPAGGKFDLNVKTKQAEKIIKDVVMGEVWLVAGQSNIQFELHKAIGGHHYIQSLINQDIRNLKVPMDASLVEQTYAPMQWFVASLSNEISELNHEQWSAVGSIFVSELQTQLNTPVAMIQVSWGSASIEGFSPRSLAKQFSHFQQQLDNFDTNDAERALALLSAPTIAGTAKLVGKDNIYIRTKPNILYNKMLHPLLPLSIRGILWYQGEANSKKSERVNVYGDFIKAWLQQLRSAFEDPNLHLTVVQLPGFKPAVAEGYGPLNLNKLSWAFMREQQNKVLMLDNTSVSVNHDLGLLKNIHPTDKLPVGQRAANVVLKEVYNEVIDAYGPIYQSHQIVGNKVIVSFKHNRDLTTRDGTAPKSFYLANEKGLWYQAEAKILANNAIELSSKNVATPTHVRYAWSGKPEVNLTNNTGLPAWSFRSDQQNIN